MKMKNKILAMEAAPAATPPNPKIAAIMATIRNITVQRSIKNNLGLKKLVTVCRCFHSQIRIQG
jgi:hypothetical protein